MRALEDGRNYVFGGSLAVGHHGRQKSYGGDQFSVIFEDYEIDVMWLHIVIK